MKALLDSSVLVAAHLPTHAHYAASSTWLRQAAHGTFDLLIAAHSLAEAYSVLTRLPLRPPISPHVAWQFLETNVLPAASIHALSPDDYTSVLQDAAQGSWSGGVIYDALIAKVADIHAVDHLVTLNVGHFQRVWPAGVSKIVTPHALSPP